MSSARRTLDWLAGGGEMSSLIASRRWDETPLGPIESWPASLRTTVSLCLASNFPINIIWGPEHIQIYNSGYRIVCGDAHPRALGEPYTVTWASAWPAIGKPFERALAGETSYLENQRMFLERNGYAEETFFTFSLSPIRDETGRVVGLFHPVTETTPTMLAQRRTRALRDVAEKAGNAKTVAEAAAQTLHVLRDFARDVPMVLLYLREGESIRLAGTNGAASGSAIAPAAFIAGSAPWPLPRGTQGVAVPEVQRRFGDIVCGEYPEPLRDAFVVPLSASGNEAAAGWLVVGASTRLPLDQGYRDFFSMLGSTVSAAINNARSYEDEKRRAEALAELDRAKSTFFSNVSHEFRTPLTLMLGPLEGLLEQSGVTSVVRAELEVVHRSALRLLKLVNALLDFSRLEANGMEGSYEPTDLGQLTADLASAFRSAIERAGMELRIETPVRAEAVHVDREMWEKIVLNLLSNAFKYTTAGEIAVRLRYLPDHVELAVRDTGAGIPRDELPRIFQRFHRVQGTQGRTHEGTGIGLALVQELVQLHSGTIRVESEPGQGSRFIVCVPLGTRHLPQDRISSQTRPLAGQAPGAAAFVEEALRWIPEADAGKEPVSGASKHVLLADDNADMRDYVRRLLERDYQVTAVSDGQQALTAARKKRPDLVLTDIMMPVLDGIGLLRAIRGDPALRTVPVILLSARAGEEAKASGIELGADDYLTKPFSAKEMLARIRTQLQMAEVREQSIRKEVRTAELERLLQSRDEFLTVVAHELKTPLTSLRLQLQMSRRNVRSPAVASAVEVCVRQVDRLASLVDDLLDVSRLHGGRMTYRRERVHLPQLIQEVVDRFRAQLKAIGSRVTVDDGEDVVAYCDRLRVEQILVNLLSNALKYGAQKPIEISLASHHGMARIDVRDRGIGISAEAQRRIFSRFERGVSSRNYSGLGLGLFIARQIAEAHGGTIEVRSSPGAGSLFTVILPLDGATVQAAAGADRSAGGAGLDSASPG